MTDTQKITLNSQAQAILAQLDALSKVVKHADSIVGIEREEVLEMLQQPYKNIRFIIRKVNQM